MILKITSRIARWGRLLFLSLLGCSRSRLPQYNFNPPFNFDPLHAIDHGIGLGAMASSQAVAQSDHIPVNSRKLDIYRNLATKPEIHHSFKNAFLFFIDSVMIFVALIFASIKGIWQQTV